MQLFKRPVVKICCISSIEEAHLAIAAGASALGLVSSMPSGPGVIADDLIAAIAARVPPEIATFLLTARQDAVSIVQQHRRCRTSVLQFVDRLSHQDLRAIKAELPEIELVQVIHITGNESIAEACAVAPLVDALLLDSGNQTLAVKELGGTGRTHDWGLSRTICKSVDTPVFLAGGLGAHNVAAAIATVAPFGIDLCSSVRTNGQLDTSKLDAFFKALPNA